MESRKKRTILLRWQVAPGHPAKIPALFSPERSDGEKPEEEGKLAFRWQLIVAVVMWPLRKTVTLLHQPWRLFICYGDRPPHIGCFLYVVVVVVPDLTLSPLLTTTRTPAPMAMMSTATSKGGMFPLPRDMTVVLIRDYLDIPSLLCLATTSTDMALLCDHPTIWKVRSLGVGHVVVV